MRGVNVSAKTGWRNRGYSDGLAGREKRPPEDAKLRSVYLDGYRRGNEARARTGAAA